VVCGGGGFVKKGGEKAVHEWGFRGGNDNFLGRFRRRSHNGRKLGRSKKQTNGRRNRERDPVGQWKKGNNLKKNTNRRERCKKRKTPFLPGPQGGPSNENG